MGTLREMSDKVSDFADKYELANPIEVMDETLGGQTREESKVRRQKAKEAKSAPPPQMPKESVPSTPKGMKKGGVAGKLATRGYGKAR